MTAGQLLQCHSPSDLINVMSRQLAPYICNHEAEQQSCATLLMAVSILAGTAALSATAISTAVASALPIGAYFVAKQILLYTWLNRQQTYDADVVAAAISTAAGCHPDEVLASMQRAHVAAVEQSDMQQQVTEAIGTELQALSSLLPNLVLPTAALADSKDLQLLNEAVSQHLTTASAQTHADYKEHMRRLQDLIAHKLIAVRSPLQGLFGKEPQWLDRVARVEKFLGEHEFSAPCDIIDPGKTLLSKTRGIDLHQLMALYHDCQHWPAVTAVRVEDLHSAHQQLRQLSRIRSKSTAEVAVQVQADRDRAYDLLTYARALRLELFTK